MSALQQLPLLAKPTEPICTQDILGLRQMSTPTEWEKGKNLCSYTLKKAIGCVCRPASELVWPVGLGRWLSPCMWHWSGRTSNTVLSFGVFSTRRTCSCFSMCREEQGSWWRDWETKIVRDGWGCWGCLVWRGGGWGEASMLQQGGCRSLFSAEK